MNFVGCTVSYDPCKFYEQMNIDDYRNLTAVIVLNCIIIVNHIVFDLKRSYFRKNRVFALFRASKKLIENKLIEAPVEIEKWRKYLGVMYKGREPLV